MNLLILPVTCSHWLIFAFLTIVLLACPSLLADPKFKVISKIKIKVWMNKIFFFKVNHKNVLLIMLKYIIGNHCNYLTLWEVDKIKILPTKTKAYQMENIDSLK